MELFQNKVAVSASLPLTLFCICIVLASAQQNPVFPGWYADPEGIIYDDKYWIFPTFSSTEQLHFDAFSSSDLANWTTHPRIIDNAEVKWATHSMWAPSTLRKDGKYYFFFSSNAINEDTTVGGIGVGVADEPQGPYKDLLGRPLINAIANGAQPIDQFVFKDLDGTYYMFYGGTCHTQYLEHTRVFPKETAQSFDVSFVFAAWIGLTIYGCLEKCLKKYILT
jgi:beta-xylosidase